MALFMTKLNEAIDNLRKHYHNAPYGTTDVELLEWCDAHITQLQKRVILLENRRLAGFPASDESAHD